MNAPQDRYEVRPVGQGFAIRDMQMRAYCSLGGTPLAWRTRREAQDWLRLCYVIWGTSPAVGEEPPARERWQYNRRFREETPRSPWEGYTRPLYP